MLMFIFALVTAKSKMSLSSSNQPKFTTFVKNFHFRNCVYNLLIKMLFKENLSTECKENKNLRKFFTTVFCYKKRGQQYTYTFLLLIPQYDLAPLQNDYIVASRCMQFNFGDKGEVYLLDKSALPVNKKERMQEEKRTIGPRMNAGGLSNKKA